MSEIANGRCLCGEVTFEFSGDPKWVVNCHCETCRRNTSSPMTTWISVPNDAFRFTNGTLSSYRSSPGVTRKFCPACGTPISFETDKMPGEVHLYAASMIDPNAFRPTAHVFEEERLSWFDVFDDLPRFATTRRGGKAEPTHFGPNNPS
jgi:hypothetical protein